MRHLVSRLLVALVLMLVGLGSVIAATPTQDALRRAIGPEAWVYGLADFLDAFQGASRPLTPATLNRAPTPSDGAGYSVGNIWVDQSTGRVWQATDVTVGAARWSQLPTPALPLDVVPGASVAFGTRQLGSAYVTNKLIDITCAASPFTIGFLANGAIDLNATTKNCGSALPVITKWYDQSGAALDCVPPATTNDPELPTFPFVGSNVPPVLFNQSRPVPGSAFPPASEYCAVPAGLALTGNTVTVMMVADVYDGGLSVPLGVIGLPTTTGGIPMTSNLGIANLGVFSSAGGGNNTNLQRLGMLHPAVIGFADTATTRNAIADETVTTASRLSYAAFGTGAWIGAYGTGASPTAFGGARIWAFIVWPFTLSQAQMDAVRASLNLTFGMTPQVRDPNIACDGDSRAQGYGASQSRNVCTRMQSLLPVPVRMGNAGRASQTTAQQGARYAANVAPLFNPNVKNNILTLETGINNFIVANQTAVVAYAELVAYVAQAHATGWRIGCDTPLPYAALAGATLTEYNNYLALVRANAANCDFIVDLAADPILGPQAATSNTALYTDGTHLTDAGQDIEAQIRATSIIGQIR
jgi:lysophospholipase L1-like esterase